MPQPNRRVTLAAFASSAIAVLGGLATGVAGQPAARAATQGVAFTSAPAQAAIVSAGTVTPAQRAGGTAPGTGTDTQGSDDQRPELNPKTASHPRSSAASHARTGSAAAGSDNTVNSSKTHTPKPSASFVGMQGSNKTCDYFPKGCNPPDMGLAASPSWVLQGVNTSFSVTSTTGAVQPGFPVTARRFFQVPNETNNDGTPCDAAHGSAPFLSDPRAYYDATDHRFWAAVLQVQGAFGAAADCDVKTFYWIAVSRTDDPRGAWNVYQFDMADGSTYAADYTQIGITHDALYFSANMFNADATGVGFYSEVFEANKALMERGSTAFSALGFKNLQGTGPGTTAATGPFVADTVQPVSDLGGNQDDNANGSRDGLFVDTMDGPDVLTGNTCTSATDACRGLVVWRMKNPIAHDRGGPAPTFSGTLLADTKPFYVPPASNQPSCNQCIDSNDLRIPASVMRSGSTIVTAWGTGIDNGTQVVPGIVTARVELGDGEQGGPTISTAYFNLPGDQAATYPALLPQANGQVLMVYEHMSHSTFPEMKYTVSSGDRATFTDPGRVLKAGEANYRPTLCGGAVPVCRWGDYEAVSSDGNGRAWMAGEYTNTNTNPAAAPAYGRNWGTWIGAIGSGSQG